MAFCYAVGSRLPLGSAAEVELSVIQVDRIAFRHLLVLRDAKLLLPCLLYEVPLKRCSGPDHHGMGQLIGYGWVFLPFFRCGIMDSAAPALRLLQIPVANKETVIGFYDILHGTDIGHRRLQFPYRPDIFLLPCQAFLRCVIRMGKECEKDGGYWESNTEMTARAFACYIKDRLPYRSDYLAGHADCAVTLVTDKNGDLAVLKAYPEGEEREAINAAFDEVMEALKHDGFFSHADNTLPTCA